MDGRTIDLDLTWTDLGAPASVTYPNDSGLGDPSRTVSNAYSWGMLTGVTSYTTSISYHPNLMVNAVAHANGATVTYAKDDNDMRRPKSVATTGTASNWSSGTYAFDGAGNVKAIGSDWYTYDDVSRLTVGTTTAGTKRQCATFNAFGTITGLGIGTSSCSPSPISIDAASNHMADPVEYNAAGAMLDWTDYTYTWDPLGQMASVYGGSMTKRTFLYTADGERIEERVGSNPLSPTSRIIAVRGLDSKVLRLFTDSGAGLAWTKDYVYRGGLPLASVDGAGTKHFHLDHLGTIRRITGTGTPAAVVGSHDYYPFGLEATDPTQDAERLKFTGHERDQQGTSASQVDDLDYMHARYYNPNVARFLSVDPGRDNNLKVPQSWNLYAYVRNRPLTMVDPTGLLAYVAKILGNEVKIHIDDDLPMKRQLALKKGLDAAFTRINKATQKLTTDEKKIIGNIRSVDVYGGGNENKPGFVNEATGAFSLRAATVDQASPAYLGSTLAHDGMHTELFKLMGVETSRGRAAEEQCLQFQLGVGRKIGLSGDEQSYLRYLIANPEQMDPYIWAPTP